MSAACSNGVWSGWRITTMLPWPGVPGGHNASSALLVWALLHVRAAEIYRALGQLVAPRGGLRGLKYLFVDHHIYLNARLCPSLEHAVEAPFLVMVRRPAKKLPIVSQGLRRTARKTYEFGGEPPIGNVDDLRGIFQRHRDSLSPVSESNCSRSAGRIIPRNSPCRPHTTLRRSRPAHRRNSSTCASRG